MSNNKPTKAYLITQIQDGKIFYLAEKHGDEETWLSKIEYAQSFVCKDSSPTPFADKSKLFHDLHSLSKDPLEAEKQIREKHDQTN
jgi:hypothetical protein